MKNSGDKPTEDRFKEFGQRLDKTIASRKKPAGPDSTDGQAAGFAMRAVTELLVGLGVCTIGGYFLDRYLGTTPWLMIILMPLGLAAGIWNVMRMSQSKQAEEIMGGDGQTPASIPDDDED
jgi:ATP synthase protein I